MTQAWDGMDPSKVWDSLEESIKALKPAATLNATDTQYIVDVITAHDEQVKSLAENDNFLLLMGLLVFLMQAGFGFLEAGCVRAKNVTNILFKNYLDVAVASLCYWAIGWAISNGDEEGGNGFIYDQGNWFLNDELRDQQISSFFFQFAFAATAATIVSGAVAERVKFEAYLIYSAVITGLIYPIGAYWGWHGSGWLKKGIDIGEKGAPVMVQYTDYAGSGIVHCVGGTAALVGAIVTGPRLARKMGPIPGHNIAFQALGGFILMFGFFAFNGGSELAANNPGATQNVGQAFISTLLCGGAGMITAVATEKFISKIWNLSTAINGSLTGMVAACAGCDGFRPYAAVIVGVIAGLVYIGVEKLMIKLKIDDPLNAVGVHLGGGFWGVIACALMHEDVGAFYNKFDKPSGTLLGWNLLGVLAYIVWAGSTSLSMFMVLKVTGMLRVSEEQERAGLDVSKHGGVGYYMLMDDNDERPVSGKVHPNMA